MTALTLPTGETLDPGMVGRMLAELDHAIGTRHKALTRQLLQIGTRLEAGKADLTGKLDAGWDWLAAHDDDARFAVWAGWLAAYTTVCDVQAAIRDGVAS